MNIKKMSKLIKDGGTEAMNEFLINQSYKDGKREGLVKGLVIGGCLGVILTINYINDVSIKEKIANHNDPEEL